MSIKLFSKDRLLAELSPYRMGSSHCFSNGYAKGSIAITQAQASHPIDDESGERDFCQEDLGASVISGCHVSPILEPAVHDLDHCPTVHSQGECRVRGDCAVCIDACHIGLLTCAAFARVCRGVSVRLSAFL